MDNNNTKKDAKITYVPEIQKIVTDRYVKCMFKNEHESPKIIVYKKHAMDVLDKAIVELDSCIEYCKKYFCTISIDDIQDMFPEVDFQWINIDLMPVKVTLDNETRIYVQIAIYVDGHFIVGREYNEMHDANPSEGAEYNTIFASQVIDN